MPRDVSIRRSLLLNMVMVIVLLSGAIFIATFIGTRGKLRMLAEDLTRQTLDRAEGRLDHFFEPVIQQLMIARRWGEEGLLSTEDPAELNRLLLPLIEEHPQISSVMVADERGREHMLLRTPGQWTSRQTRRDEWGGRTRWLEWTDEQPEPEGSFRDLEYDPRVRPWFEGAVAAGAAGVHWTAPYTFYTTRDPGITASITYDPGDGYVHVVALDVLLSDISKFTTNLAVGKEGALFVLTDESRVIGLPRHALFDDEQDIREALLKRSDELGLPLATDAAEAFKERGLAGGGPVRFRSDGRQWWGETRPFGLGPDRMFTATVVVPETDLLGEMAQIRVLIVAIAAAALGVAIFHAHRLAARFSRPIEALAEHSDRIGRLDLEPGAPVKSSFAEVHRLAETQEKMRVSLKSLLKLERDLQLARQIQQNTLPLKLPTLPGFELAAMTEPADETGGDSYDIIGLRRPGEDRPPLLTEGAAPEAAMLLADATGHGIGPALSVSQIRAMLRISLRLGAHPGEFMHEMNEQLHADLPEGRFITAFFGYLVAEAGDLYCFSAGQAPLLYFVASEKEVRALHADFMPLGIVPDLEIQEPPPIHLQPGDIFAVISDGIFEAMNGGGEQFGTDRTIEVIREHHRRGASEILTALRTAVNDFAGGRPADDDRTAIIIKRTGR